MTTPYAGTNTPHTTIDIINGSDPIRAEDIAAAQGDTHDNVIRLYALLSNQLKVTQGSGGIGTLVTLATGALTNVSGVAVTITPEVNDKLLCVCSGNLLAATSPAQAELRVRYSSASTSVAVLGGSTQKLACSTLGTGFVCGGLAIAGFAEAFTFQLQAFDGADIASAGINMTNSWFMAVFCLKGP